MLENNPSNPSYWGDDAISILNNVRLGQPNGRLFSALSPSVEHSLNYIDSAIRHGHPLVKLIVGEMGSGKSTLCGLFSKTATDAGAKVVGINLPHLATLRQLNIVSDMVSDIGLVTACVTAIRDQVFAGQCHLDSAIAHAFSGHKISSGYRAVAAYYAAAAKAQDEDNPSLSPDLIAQELSESMKSWMLSLIHI